MPRLVVVSKIVRGAMTLVDILHHLVADIEHVEHIQDLLDVLLAHPSMHTKTLDWARAMMAKT